MAAVAVTSVCGAHHPENGTQRRMPMNWRMGPGSEYVAMPPFRLRW